MMISQQTIKKFSSFSMLSLLFRYPKILMASTIVELNKRYSGSILGKVWVVLYPLLLLSIYLFVYMVIFKMRFPGYSQLDYVLFVFCGLIPYIGFMEALTTGCLSIKQNIHLVKNVLFPIELIPVRTVLIAMVGQLVSMGILILLLGVNGNLSFHLLWVPVIFILQVMMLIGLVWILAALGVGIPDVSHFVNLFVMLLFFVSPIGFKPEMVPEGLRGMVYLNPIYYFTEMYRASMLYGQWPQPSVIAIYVGLCLVSFALGSAFFYRFKSILVDYE
jgi:lipopolysaccharide transport system permease protein